MKDGKPCSHVGCANHVTHPCEVCGRIACIAPVVDEEMDELIDEYFGRKEVKTKVIYETNKI